MSLLPSITFLLGRYCPASFPALFDLRENDWLEFTILLHSSFLLVKTWLRIENYHPIVFNGNIVYFFKVESLGVRLCQLFVTIVDHSALYNSICTMGVIRSSWKGFHLCSSHHEYNQPNYVAHIDITWIPAMAWCGTSVISALSKYWNCDFFHLLESKVPVSRANCGLTRCLSVD